jgi:DNA-binding IclR family transcriptional regulator
VATSLSRALRKLLDTRLDSFEKLELVMALRRSEARRSTIGELAHELDLARDDVRRIVLDLMKAGLVTCVEDQVTLAPRAAGDQGVLDELAAAYQQDKMTVVKPIAESALDRLRNLAGRAFADAFVIGKKSGGDHDR